MRTLKEINQDYMNMCAEITHLEHQIEKMFISIKIKRSQLFKFDEEADQVRGEQVESSEIHKQEGSSEVDQKA